MAFTSYTQYYNSIINPVNKYYFRGGEINGDTRGLFNDFFNQVYPVGNSPSRTLTPATTLDKNSMGAIPIPQLSNSSNYLYICGADLGVISNNPVIVYDRLVMFRYNPTTSTATTLNGLSATTRYSTDKRLLFFVENNASSFTARKTFTINYTNQDGVANRIGSGQIADLNVISLANVNYGTFANLQSGDTGVLSVQSITINGAADLQLSIVKPLCVITGYGPQTSSQSSIPNLINGGLNGGLPIINENACLAIMRPQSPAPIRLAISSTYIGNSMGNLIIAEA